MSFKTCDAKRRSNPRLRDVLGKGQAWWCWEGEVCKGKRKVTTYLGGDVQCQRGTQVGVKVVKGTTGGGCVRFEKAKDATVTSH